MRYELFVGLRYLKAKTRMSFVPVITFISVAGVAVGVMALVVVISVMNGFDTDLRKKILGNQSHLLIESYAPMKNVYEIIEDLEKRAGISAAAPVIVGHGLIRTSDTAIGEGVRIKGIDPRYEVEVTDIGKNILIGNLDALIPSTTETQAISATNLFEEEDETPGVVLGKVLAERLFHIPVFDREQEKQALKLALGRRIEIISPLEEKTPLGKRWRSQTFRVVGLFDSGLFEYDSSYALVGLDSGGYLFDLARGEVRRVEVFLEDLEKANEQAEELSVYLAEEYDRLFELTTWMEMNQTFFTALRIEKIAMFIILVLIVLVAAFNIASTLIMVVMEKTRDIGILRSIGASRRGIMAIFVIEGVFIGVVGTTLGLVSGVAICLFLEQYGLDLPGKGSIYYIDQLPVEMRLSDILLVTALSIGTCLLSSFYPAWQAAKLIPVEALRYE